MEPEDVTGKVGLLGALGLVAALIIGVMIYNSQAPTAVRKTQEPAAAIKTEKPAAAIKTQEPEKPYPASEYTARRLPAIADPAPNVTGSQDRRDAEQFVKSLPSRCHGSVSGDSPAYVDYRCDDGTTGHITLQNGRVRDIR